MKINLSFPLVVMALIIGFAIYNDFDFGALNFKHPWLAVVYIIAFAITIFFMFNGKGANSN